jgi:hypothetical protein
MGKYFGIKLIFFRGFLDSTRFFYARKALLTEKAVILKIFIKKYMLTKNRLDYIIQQSDNIITQHIIQNVALQFQALFLRRFNFQFSFVFLQDAFGVLFFCPFYKRFRSTQHFE